MTPEEESQLLHAEVRRHLDDVLHKMADLTIMLADQHARGYPEARAIDRSDLDPIEKLRRLRDHHHAVARMHSNLAVLGGRSIELLEYEASLP